MKNKRGITLIALIITIIVMLIMVGVAINVVVTEGVLSRAKKAAEQIQFNSDKEELISAVAYAFDYKTQRVNRSKLIRDLTAGWKVSDEAPYICTSPKGNVFIVNQNGSIDDIEFDIAKYILGDDLKGRNISELVDENYEFINKDIKFLNGNYENSMYYLGEIDYASIYVTYKDNPEIYRVRISRDFEEKDEIKTIPEDGENKLYVIPKDTNIGKTATIGGEKFIVLFDAGEQGENVQLISANVYEPNNIYIGKNDNMVDWTNPSVISEANLFNDTDGEDVLSDTEKYIYSYNHAIENFNKKLEDLLREYTNNENSDILDIRCVGSNPTNKNSESQMAESALLQRIPKSSNIGGYETGAFNGKIRDKDNNYIYDDERMWLLGIRKAENNYEYWRASRSNWELELDNGGMADNQYFTWNAYTNFGIHVGVCEKTEDVLAGMMSKDIFAISKSENTFKEGTNYGLRPVITIKASALSKYLD